MPSCQLYSQDQEILVSRSIVNLLASGGMPGVRVTMGIMSASVVDEHVAWLPPTGMRPFVAGYTGYRQAGIAPAVHRGLPSPFLTVIFTLDDPLEITAHPDPGQPAARYDTLVGGLHTAPALVAHDGRQSGIQVYVSPLGARALLGLPAGELASRDLEGSEVLGPLAGRVRQRLQECRTWPGRFAALDDVLAGLAGPAADRAVAVSPEVTYAWHALLRSGGRLTVSRLAADTGWSDRYLRARFSREVGLTPKAAARVIRFDRARRRLARQALAGLPPGLADVAAATGYYDQAHLDREFAALAGLAPSVWLAREFRNVQAADGSPVAG
jgi:AraC-like DNA-binding protein